jgi:hypothetical protein
MIENVRLTIGSQILEIDRTRTEDYVLDTVNFGDRDVQFLLRKLKNSPSFDFTSLYKRISVLEITGWVVCDERVPGSLAQRKTRLNNLIIPNTVITLQCSNENGIAPNPMLFGMCRLTESIRYGTTESDNNEAFCKFLIAGVYRQ